MLKTKPRIVWLWVFFLCPVALWAQLDLRLETPTSIYLQYAPVPVNVKLKNLAETWSWPTSPMGLGWK